MQGLDRLWITGGRGFIGARVVQQARAAGAEVHPFAGDVRDPGQVSASLVAFKPTHILNLAAPVDVRRDPALGPTMNAVIHQGALNVYEAAGDAVLVQCGTCEEYGTIEAPFTEADTPSAPVSPYSAAKLAATRDLLERHARSPAGPRVVVARPFLTYGPNQSTRALVPAAIDAAIHHRPFPMTAGLQTRELNYVDDIARGLLLAATTPAAVGQIVNLASGDEHRVVDIARLIFELADAPDGLLQPGAIPTRGGEVPRFFGDTTRCRALLDYRPTVPLREGLRRTIAAARATP